MQILTPERRFETRSANPLAPWGSTAPPPPGQVGRSVAGVELSERTALQLASVWGSTALISDSIATLPIRQWKATSLDAATEIEPSPVIVQPWSEMYRRDFITQGTMSFLLRGNLFGNIVARDERQYPTQVQLVHPDHAKVTRNRKTGQVEVRYWNQIVTPDAVTRAMGLSVPEGIVGLSPIEHMRNTLGVARAQDLYSGSFYANSARPDGVIQVEGELDDDETKAMAKSWLAAHQGIGHAFLPAVLTGGAEWKSITMSHQDAQFLEMMNFSASVISGMIFRCPPHMLGMVDKTTSWGAGIEQQETGFVRNTLLIWLARWEDLMTSWLPPRQFVTFDLSERLRGDTLQRWSAWQIARVIGAMNNAEIRKAEGLPEITEQAQATVLADFAAPLNSAPVKPTSTGGAGGDKAD